MSNQSSSNILITAADDQNLITQISSPRQKKHYSPIPPHLIYHIAAQYHYAIRENKLCNSGIENPTICAESSTQIDLSYQTNQNEILLKIPKYRTRTKINPAPQPK